MLSRFSDNGHHEMSSMSAQVHVQSSVLSGGVAIGVAMTAVHTPWIAMTIGFCAALLSALGFRYMKVSISEFFFFRIFKLLFNQIYK